MEITIAIVAFLASLLTFFSGFGLGTILLPVFAFFFPVNIAIALTAVVHLLNNLFKFALVYKKTEIKTAVRFGLSSILFAFLGAWLMLFISDFTPLLIYNIGESSFKITAINIVIGAIILIFSLSEIFHKPAIVKIKTDNLIFGGALSGFLGGLSGIQGAVRSAFLIKALPDKESYIATGVVIACIIDFSRLTVYGFHFIGPDIINHQNVLLLAVISAWFGAVIGNKLLKKIQYETIRNLVAIMLIIIALMLILGLL